MKFWSDVHFSHEAILRFCPKTRPFKNVDEMNEAVVERWNKKVGINEDIYFLGDFAFGKDPESHFYRLNGRKHLVTGNHDEHKKSVMALPWTSIHDIVTVKYSGLRAVLCHFPLESWKSMHHGYLHFHGHQHGSGRKMNKRFDVGFDAFPDGPMSFEELAELASKQEFIPIDHHGKAD